MAGCSVKIVQEVARSCPYPLNEGMSAKACLWIYHEHVKKELEAVQKFDMVICDRSAIDSFMYAKAQGVFDPNNELMQLSFHAAQEWMKSYHRILYVKPNGALPEEDGVRSTDIDFQKRVEDEFDQWVAPHWIPLNMTMIFTDDIFDQKLEFDKF